MFNLITNNEWTIKLTPYEILSVDKKPLSFIKESFCLNDEMMNCIKKDNLDVEINVTKTKSNSDKFIKKQFTTPFYKYISIMITRLNYKKKYKFYKVSQINIIVRLLKYLLFLDVLFMKIFSKLLIKEYKLSDNSKTKIYNIYRYDNKLLKDLLSEFNLTKYGYFKY